MPQAATVLCAMRVRELHPWHVAIEEAAEIQRTLRARVRHEALALENIRLVAGADVSYSRGSNDIFAAVVVLSFPELTVVEMAGAMAATSFPYVPGFLSFREGPALSAAFAKISSVPDVVLFDGQGIAHPRGFGIASHMGVLLDIPSVGCAKSVLVGAFEEPAPARGATSPLVKGEQVIGVALRTRERVAPVFVSVGHRADIEGAVELVLACAPKYRVPEPIRRAHGHANELRRQAS